jgi:peptide/nickel transport system substrate-binding protein
VDEDVSSIKRAGLLRAVAFDPKRRSVQAAAPGNTYRYDPDAFFGRNLHSKSQYAQVLSGWQNEKYDQLVEEAKRTLDRVRRRALYTEAWNLVNTELPHFYLHEEVYTSAATKALQGYQPSMMGALHYHGGGLRTAYLRTAYMEA